VRETTGSEAPVTKPSAADTTQTDPQLGEMARMWGGGWRRYFFPAFWLVYLGQAVDGATAWKRCTPPTSEVGYNPSARASDASS
jgi:hypothetical protein